MAIYKTAINKPITTALVFVAVIVLGLFSLSRLPIDQMPEMDPPYITVMTTYAGANASEIETNITKTIENALNSVDGLKNITSTSKDNISVVTLEFQWGLDLDEALNDIRSYVDLVYDNLPDGVSRPMILKLNSNSRPIMMYGFTAKESYPGLDRIIEDNVTNELNRIDGIGNITVSGAPEALYLHRPRPQTARRLPPQRGSRGLCHQRQQPRPRFGYHQNGQGAVPDARERRICGELRD